MRQTILAAAMFLICASTAVCEPWGADYFPNVPLITEDGKSVRFFDDLIKDKVVLINFIYTRCPDTCPLETAQLVNVQKILGDRVGKDVFFYSISIDPKNDTPSVLKEYKEMFRAGWTFLTGKESDIIKLRKKLGLFIPEIQDRSYNHNVNMIIGNQATGRWMKRSPFENPYVLADQIGNWLQGWKLPPEGSDYANAPKLRTIPPGEQLFRTRCTSCHSLTGHEQEDALGPDLLGVTQRREMNWLLNWLKAPDQMLKEKNPITMALYKQYNELAMPNLRLNQQEAEDLIAYIDEESQRVREKDKRAPEKSEDGGYGASVTAALADSHAKPASDVVAIMNAWVREAHLGAKMNAGYMTLINVNSEEVSLVKVECEAFEKIEIHEMAMVDGLMTMRELANLVIPANGQVQLKPGGMHLMLMGPRKNLTTGQQVDMTLTFQSGIQQTISVGVFATEGNAIDLSSSDVVAIMNAWVREAHLGAKMNAGYMTLINVDSEEVSLVKVECEAFEKIEIHEMAMVDGLTTMRELANLVIPANGQVQLKPGGMHLMLMGPHQNLTAGQQVDMTLTFNSGIKQTVSVGVFVSEGNAKDFSSKKYPPVDVVFETTMGVFTLKLNPEKAPKTVTNFLTYVDEGFYNNTLIHRVIPQFVVKGGGFEKGMIKKQPHPPVENESHNGLKNRRGTISMAHTQDSHSAASQFFINVVDNPSLDLRNNQPGSTVFGTVTEGMAVIDKMVAVPTMSLGEKKDVPKEDIVILSAKRKELTVAQDKKNIVPKVYEVPIVLGREQIMAVISYLQTLGGEVDIATINKFKDKAQELSEKKVIPFVPPIEVEPAVGEKIFFDDTREGACTKCHMINGKGNKGGPDLTGIGAVLTPQYLIESILKPGEVITKGFETMYLITTDGMAYNGIVQSQTEEEVVLLVDEEGEIEEYAFHPDEIEQMQKQDISIMPDNFSDMLSTREFYGIVSYLLSLKE